MRKTHDPAKVELALALLSWVLLIVLVITTIVAIGGILTKSAYAAELLYDSGDGNNSYVYFNSATDKVKYTLTCAEIGAENYEIENVEVRLYGNTGSSGSVDFSIGGTATDTISVPPGGYTWYDVSTSYVCHAGENVNFYMKANDAYEQLWSGNSVGTTLGTITQYGTTDSGNLKYLTLKIWGNATTTGGGGGGENQTTTATKATTTAEIALSTAFVGFSSLLLFYISSTFTLWMWKLFMR